MNQTSSIWHLFALQQFHAKKLLELMKTTVITFQDGTLCYFVVGDPATSQQWYQHNKVFIKRCKMIQEQFKERFQWSYQYQAMIPKPNHPANIPDRPRNIRNLHSDVQYDIGDRIELQSARQEVKRQYENQEQESPVQWANSVEWSSEQSIDY